MITKNTTTIPMKSQTQTLYRYFSNSNKIKIDDTSDRRAEVARLDLVVVVDAAADVMVMTNIDEPIGERRSASSCSP